VLELAAVIAHTHHERFDGSGYPRGLAGADIPLEGRIAAVADVFDALTSDRIYRPALPVDEAVAMMCAQRGAHFDPELLDIFLERLTSRSRSATGRAIARRSPSCRAASGGRSDPADGRAAPGNEADRHGELRAARSGRNRPALDLCGGAGGARRAEIRR
jgi:hypothetical protein